MNNFRYIEIKDKLQLAKELTKTIKSIIKVNQRDKNIKSVLIINKIPMGINIDNLNKFLVTHRVYCLTSDKLYLTIKDAKYGFKNPINVTEKVQKLQIENKLIISDKTDINAIFGDPEPGVEKFLTVTFNVCGCRFTEMIKEHNTKLTKTLMLDFSNMPLITRELIIDLDDKLEKEILEHM